MKLLILFELLKYINALSWVCNYPNDIIGPVSTHFLYKEDNVNQVKWLEKYEYCRAKGDKSVYIDAGQGKCEYSRGICMWDNENCVLDPNRQNDPLSECLDLLNNNELVDGLDNGRFLLQQSQSYENVFTTTTDNPTFTEVTPVTTITKYCSLITSVTTTEMPFETNNLPVSQASTTRFSIALLFMYLI